MNEDRQLPGAAPGSGAGDAATSQEIPRPPKPAKKMAPKSEPVKKTTSKPTAKNPPGKNGVAGPPTAGSSGASSTPESIVDSSAEPKDETISNTTAASEATTDSTTVTDKGREREASPERRRIEPVTPGRTLTAADYARTTTPSAATTSVIPVVKDEPEAPAVAAASPAGGSGRQASLRLNHVEPWSVARIAFAISVAMMIVAVVAMTIFWVVLDRTGVWGQINEAVTSVLSDDSSSFNITDYLGFSRLIGLTLVLSAINVVLMTALATIGAHLYNLAAQVLGGIEVTFSEDA